jgi:hypothetical protein
MATYTEICKLNRQLYTQLEYLSLLIKTYSDLKDHNMVNVLSVNKEELKMKIEANLTRLENLWRYQRKLSRIPEAEASEIKQQSVIVSYEAKPIINQIPAIAERYDLPVATVCRIISAHLNNVA